MVLLAVSIAPIYAQNLHIDEQEQQIRDEIKRTKILIYLAKPGFMEASVMNGFAIGN